MARIYSNSFFHYTTQEGLLGILQEGFKATYCKEQFKNKEGEIKYIGIPMISFCDIPLSLLSEVVYGDRGYAIGMKREWGLKKCLIPVFYYSPSENSMSTKLLQDSCSKFYANQIHSGDAQYTMLGISKPYEKFEDEAYIKGRKKENYQEREWRKIDYSQRIWYDLKCYTEWRGVKKSKPYLNEKLEFTIDDIELIMVKNDKTAQTVIKKILNPKFKICGQEISDKLRYQLISKIITKDQITNNF